MPKIQLFHSDCYELLKTLPDNSVDAVVTDPPAGIAFMGKKWDNDKGGRRQWIAWLTDVMSEVYRVMKPGAHGLVWAIPKTSHWTGAALEDAGFEIRDKIYYTYGVGFPKSMNISKAIDKKAGAEREVIGTQKLQGTARRMKGANYGDFGGPDTADVINITRPATDDAKTWDGFGTALKPAVEEWVLIRKPLSEKTIVENVLLHGTGAINIDGCRVPTDSSEDLNGGAYTGALRQRDNYSSTDTGSEVSLSRLSRGCGEYQQPTGRFPANLIHDNSEEVVSLFPHTKSGEAAIKRVPGNNGPTFGTESREPGTQMIGYADKGSAARFFYSSKASKREKSNGLDDLYWRRDKQHPVGFLRITKEKWDVLPTKERHQGMIHPTVKPLSLMQYLCRLITPPGGTVLDPFLGSGTTGCAAILEGFDFIGVEAVKEYVEVAHHRILYYGKQYQDDNSKK